MEAGTKPYLQGGKPPIPSRVGLGQGWAGSQGRAGVFNTCVLRSPCGCSGVSPQHHAPVKLHSHDRGLGRGRRERVSPPTIPCSHIHTHTERHTDTLFKSHRLPESQPLNPDSFSRFHNVGLQPTLRLPLPSACLSPPNPTRAVPSLPRASTPPEPRPLPHPGGDFPVFPVRGEGLRPPGRSRGRAAST